MTSTQKLIRNLAIGFALFLAISIIMAIVSVFMFIFNLSTTQKEYRTADTNTYSCSSEIGDNVQNIMIDGYIYNIIIKQGDTFKVDFNNVSKNYRYSVEGNTLKLKNHGTPYDILSWLNIITRDKNEEVNKDSSIALTVPTDFMAKNFIINAGIGSITIQGLSTEKLDFDLAAGSIEGRNITALKNADIDCGTGKVNLQNVTLNNTDLDCGIGSTVIKGSLPGDSKIDGGIGELELLLSESSDNYNIKAEHGIGDITIDGKRYTSANLKNTNAVNSLNVDSGIGRITLSFEQ